MRRAGRVLLGVAAVLVVTAFALIVARIWTGDQRFIYTAGAVLPAALVAVFTAAACFGTARKQ